MDARAATDVTTLELELLTRAARSSVRRLDELLADDFCEVGRSGTPYTKQQVLAQLPSEGARSFDVRAMRAASVAPGVQLVSYETVEPGAAGASQRVLRNSLWVLRDGRWQMVFHQGTPAAAAEPRG